MNAIDFCKGHYIPSSPAYYKSLEKAKARPINNCVLLISMSTWQKTQTWRQVTVTTDPGLNPGDQPLGPCIVVNSGVVRWHRNCRSSLNWTFPWHQLMSWYYSFYCSSLSECSCYQHSESIHTLRMTKVCVFTEMMDYVWETSICEYV